MPTIEERFTRKFGGSVDWHRRGRELFAGGITHQDAVHRAVRRLYRERRGRVQVRHRRQRAGRLRHGQRQPDDGTQPARSGDGGRRAGAARDASRRRHQPRNPIRPKPSSGSCPA